MGVGCRYALAVLPAGEKADTRFKGGWVGLRAGLDGCGECRLHRD
jgi:hypothetical protein